jgi:hypothetical protein
MSQNRRRHTIKIGNPLSASTDTPAALPTHPTEDCRKYILAVDILCWAGYLTFFSLAIWGQMKALKHTW